MNSVYEETKFILKKYHMNANKSLGQNFLINEEVIEEIIQKSSLSREDLVIEIGPGLGTLTARLLEKAGEVVAIELDDRMIHVLEDRFKLYSNFELIYKDVLKVDLRKLIQKKLEENKKLQHVKIVANLPYYITTPIIMKLLEEKLEIESITVMVQKEVAQRLVASPGDKKAGAITYTVYYYAESKAIIKVPKESFLPEPKVDSEVIQLHIRKGSPVKVEKEENLFKVIKYAFMQRRKTLVNSLLQSGLFQNKEEILSLLKEIGLDEKVRGETLTLEQFANISNYIQ